MSKTKRTIAIKPPGIAEIPRVTQALNRPALKLGGGNIHELPAEIVGTLGGGAVDVLLNEVTLLRARVQNVENQMLRLTLGHGFGGGGIAEIPPISEIQNFGGGGFVPVKGVAELGR